MNTIFLYTYIKQCIYIMIAIRTETKEIRNKDNHLKWISRKIDGQPGRSALYVAYEFNARLPVFSCCIRIVRENTCGIYQPYLYTSTLHHSTVIYITLFATLRHLPPYSCLFPSKCRYLVSAQLYPQHSPWHPFLVFDLLLWRSREQQYIHRYISYKENFTLITSHW